MQAKIQIKNFQRKRMIRFSDLFLGNDPKGEVRAEWSSLFQSLHRNKFAITLNCQQVEYGGKDLDEATEEYMRMFDRIEDWCNVNCTGLWTIWDNESEVDENATDVDLEAHIMFEHEEDLMRFIKDCAILLKLTY